MHKWIAVFFASVAAASSLALFHQSIGGAPAVQEKEAKVNQDQVTVGSAHSHGDTVKRFKTLLDKKAFACSPKSITRPKRSASA
jgi:hypothetical protein